MKTEILNHPSLACFHARMWISDRTKLLVQQGVHTTFLLDEGELIVMTRKGIEKTLHVIDLNIDAQDYPIISRFRIIPMALARDETGCVVKAFVAFQPVKDELTCH